jgi:hypothetical protein
MEKNKTGKYFKYAIGEIILVVIGILIALSINTWNENNKSEKEAKFQLSKLRDNLKSDKAQLNEVISSNSTYTNNLIICVNVLSNETEIPKEEFFENFQQMSTTINCESTRGTFNGLISSGKIELINNQDLLDALFSYYNENSITAWDSALKDYSRNVIMPYLLDFDHIPNASNEEEGQQFTQFDISKLSVPRKTIDDYKNDLFILNALRQKIILFEGQKAAYLDLLIVIDSLISNIENEL